MKVFKLSSIVRLGWFVAVMSTAVVAGCGGKKEDKPAEVAAEGKPAPRKAESNALKSSCDELKDRGTCTDAYERAYLAGEDQVKQNCRTGVLRNEPCPTTNLLGYCDVSGGSEPAYRVAFYSGAGKSYDATTAAAACKDNFAGSFAAP